MWGEPIFLLLTEAVRIYIYMRCCRMCIGSYKVHKRPAAVIFAMLWGIDCLIGASVSPKMAVEVAPSLYFVEVLLLFGASFFYQGTAIRRILTAILLPMAYGVGKWTIIFTLFRTVNVNERQLLLGTVVSAAALGILEICMERFRRTRQEQEREWLEQEIRMYENQFQVIRQSQQAVRSLRHDMKHHMKMLADMIGNGERDNALAYLASMGAFMDKGEEYVSSGNERTDSILNYMISRAKAAGIAVEWDIQIPEQLDMSPFDSNVILSNLFENAYNAVQEVKDPRLYIRMKYDRGILCITMRNTYSASKAKAAALPSGAAPAWTAASEEHGYGLKNIRRVAGKYHGELTVNTEGDMFEANVILFLQESNTPSAG